MKIKLYITLLFCGLTLTTISQNSMEEAFKTCKAESISEYFNESVELSILDDEDVYTKTQAQIIIKTFFIQYPCESFEIVHKGAAKGDSKYTIGNMKLKEESYRVYYISKNNKILELSIEEE